MTTYRDRVATSRNSDKRNDDRIIEQAWIRHRTRRVDAPTRDGRVTDHHDYQIWAVSVPDTEPIIVGSVVDSPSELALLLAGCADFPHFTLYRGRRITVTHDAFDNA